MSPEELARAPAPDAWSVLQVMEHLVVAEEGIVVGLTKPPVPGRRVTARNVATLWMIYVIFALRIRVRVPSPRLVPAGGGSLGELEARWESARAAIRALVAPVPVMERRRPRFRHPIAGWLTLDQGLQFAARHIRHHRRQVDRIRRTFGR